MTIGTIWGMWAGLSVGLALCGFFTKDWAVVATGAYFSAAFAALLTLRIWLAS